MAGMTRRAFIGACATTVACMGVGGIAWATDAGEDRLRPPGGQDARRMAAACLKCDRCRSACPTGVIALSTIEGGFLAARTPVLDFHKGYCDFCGTCQEVCPTGALGPFDADRDKLGVAIIQKDRCIAFFQGCVECERACPYGAIVLDGAGVPVVDAAACNGCGVCEDRCPALVYRTFSGGTRRGVVVVTLEAFERMGKTVVENESEMTA